MRPDPGSSDSSYSSDSSDTSDGESEDDESEAEPAYREIPFDECNVGHWAITMVSFDGDTDAAGSVRGVNVGKIMSRNDKDKTFVLKLARPSAGLSVTDAACIKKPWYFHARETDTCAHWSVVAYFKEVTKRKCIPKAVQRTLMENAAQIWCN